MKLHADVGGPPHTARKLLIYRSNQHRRPYSLPLRLEGDRFHVVSRKRRLFSLCIGSMQSSNGYYRSDIRRRIGLACSVMSPLRSIIDWQVRPSSRTAVYPYMPIPPPHAARFHERRISSVTFTSAHLYGNVYMRVGVARSLAGSANFGLLREQSSQKWEMPCLGRRWTAVQNVTPPALSSAGREIRIRTNTQTYKQVRCKILLTTNKKWCITYRMAAFLMTLRGLRGQSHTASLSNWIVRTAAKQLTRFKLI